MKAEVGPIFVVAKRGAPRRWSFRKVRWTERGSLGHGARFMVESTPVDAAQSGTELNTYFVRSRNVLIARADFSTLYVDYYLHLADNKIHPTEQHDAMFKRALAGFVLHCVTRPWNEMTAWTLNFQEPRLNLFLTGDNEDGSVTGRAFAENVRELPENQFHADVVRDRKPARRSAVTFTGADPLVAVEAFYQQSEQRGGRFFQLGEEEFALAVEHPDCDLAWYNELDAAKIKSLDEHEVVVPMEKRIHRWHCGCNHARMMEVLTPSFRQDAADLFLGEAAIEIRCPRCAARHVITREAMEAFVADSGGKTL